MANSPKWSLNELYNAIVSNQFIIMNINEIEHGIQFILYEDLMINWYYKKGSTVAQGKKSAHRERLYALINSDSNANDTDTYPEAIPPTYRD